MHREPVAIVLSRTGQKSMPFRNDIPLTIHRSIFGEQVNFFLPKERIPK